MQTIEFSYNWNRKLNCRSFSTVRIYNPSKYNIEEIYKILLKQKGNKPVIDLGIARLKYFKPFFLDAVTPAISYLDANLSPSEFKKLVFTMYKNKNVDFTKTMMVFLVFQTITVNTPEKEK